MKTTQKGFVLIEGILIFAIIALIAGTGYYVWHSKQQTDKTLNSAQAENTAPPTVKKSTTTKSTTSSTKYFTISQWGVRAPYSGNDTLTYTLTSDDSVATVISKTLATADPGCATYGAGQINRLKPTDGSYADGTGPTVEEAATQSPSDYTHVGDYYYQFRHDQAQCGSATVDQQNQANSTTQSLVTSLQAIPQ